MASVSRMASAFEGGQTVSQESKESEDLCYRLCIACSKFFGVAKAPGTMSIPKFLVVYVYKMFVFTDRFVDVIHTSIVAFLVLEDCPLLGAVLSRR